MRPGRLAALLAALFIADAVVTVAAVFKAPYPAFVPLGSPEAYLNIYIHVPVAMVSYVLYTGAFVSAILYLAKRREIYDRYVYGFVLAGTLYAAFTLISGSLWAKESWGQAWNWDPRETGVLLLFIAYLVYFALRSSVSDPDRAPVVASTYAIAAYSMVPISYAAPRIASSSLHPTQALLQSFMEQASVRAFFFTKIALVLAIGLLVVKLYVDRGGLGPRERRLVAYSAAAAVALLFATGIYLAAGYAGGHVTRVYHVFGGPGSAKLLVMMHGRFTNVTVHGGLSAYVVDGKLALVGQIVKLIGLRGGHAASIKVLPPPCVIANLMIYALLISGLAYIVARQRRAIE